MLNVDFINYSYDEEFGSNALDAFVLITNSYKNHSSYEIDVPNVDKDYPILNGNSDDEEQILIKSHTELISIQQTYDSYENDAFHEEIIV